MLNSKLPKLNKEIPVTDGYPDDEQNRLKEFAVARGAEMLARTALGVKFFTITRWLWIANWGSLVAWVGLLLLGITGVIQGEGFLSFFVFMLAAIVFGIWLLLRVVQRFVDRQTNRAFQRLERMLQRRTMK